MPHFLIEATYSPQGLQGLQKDKASGRQAAISKAVSEIGGKLVCVYYCLGERDVIVIVDVPDTVTAASLGLAVSASGGVRTRTTPLLTIEETDKALGMKGGYRPPGAA